MEVVLISNLVSSVPRKRKTKQQLIISKLWPKFLLLRHMIWWEAKKDAIHILCKYEAICSFMMAELWKTPQETNIQKTAKSTSNMLKGKNCFTLKMHRFFFAIIWLEQRRVDKLFLVKQQAKLDENLLRVRGRGRVGGGVDDRKNLLIETMAHRNKIFKAYDIVWH